MSDQRFKYYTGYEVDNEPSDDDDDIPCNTAITNGQNGSDSSDDEFDRPLREYVEKTLAQTDGKKKSTSTSSNTFANEMENELDQIYHNFITRGTFELPISTQKTKETKTVALNQADEDDSDDEPNQPVVNNDEQEKVNDDLLYDPDEEEEDEKWMAKERLKSRGAQNVDKIDTSALGPTDAVLNCPGCMVLVCHDCQRHETNRNQYRAMFVFNCTIDENRVAAVAASHNEKSSKQKKKKNNKRFKTDDPTSVNTEEDEDQKNNQDILRPVLCSECGTEIGVYEPKEELYHFANNFNSVKPMIILEVHNRIIEELLTVQIETFLRKEKLVEIKTNIVDFDGALYFVTQTRDSPFTVSIKLKFFQELEQYGTDEILRREYGDLLVTPLEGYNATLSFDIATQLSKGEANDVWSPIVRKISMLKRYCFAAVLEKYFDFQSKQLPATTNQKRAVIHYREDETMYVNASSDRVTVIFSTVFKDPDDNVIGRVFMEGLRERRQQFQQAPQVIVSYRTPPEELKDMPDARTGDNIGYLTFARPEVKKTYRRGAAGDAATGLE
ncbi:hypothetical protein I4U23_026801 [Adineta vaga]|nr:hypothetical protein I4U23_026801 [Adineta vaga]